MSRSVALLRGINVGGRNLVAMPALVDAFRTAGYADVQTLLQSGNVVFTAASPATGPALEDSLELMLRQAFGIPVLVVVRSAEEFAATIAAAPPDHGSDALRSDVYFLKQPLTADEVWPQLPELREGVDAIAPGPGALYFSRVAAQATKTRIQRLMALPVFQRMTVRSWGTTTRLMGVLDEG
ncbi:MULTISPECIES: DUF1697 domain-containing protein [unclassified Leifsonia]|uniref:DUF1697 domain-containing protein n=1 Tax=unclassified Leifsonia TaxID=2663824 RepID=UPI0006FF8185|nr:MULTISPECIES: DUF1697 domain-containing protein [unclassified Leifsonia]KQX08275.1 hypothetical protein ASC59_11540 [Leifsonia sp. Root1293]KRA12557.1 hypothetical protein ASD61_11540 [Leifsonia sp. Root60]